ncbi:MULTISPECIES: hypothetical protein [unclassified Okeania]|uniref:hypothetical protein n=1 Tax=unclassified Okeania TaxID=2634635 RepID=UPI0013BAF2D6|nr:MULTISPECIES: hypothetical protein [unclassified Okeania]NES78357.1 hypothetical protein [Okeania sp. SIO1H4]NET12311.1 hypothetical protein [Okeania sp. SIO1H6]NET21696.1 hypothetical protein [Okeania sp. SIO1H5]NET95045.1 hypothetical protein [Okeania sp. SIO1H2]
MNSQVKINQKIIADAHVHIHKCFELDQLLNASLANFHKISRTKTDTENSVFLIFLTEMLGDFEFSKILEYAQNHQQINNWKLAPTQESISISATNNENQKIFIIAGRQIVTAEKLEVLALISDNEFVDGLPVETTIQNIVSKDSIPVLPWGVGKWIGKRGNILQKLLNSDTLSMICLGDNSGRPNFWSRPSYFQLAEKKGWKVLPGTDPLPLKSEYTKPGSFGFIVEGEFNIVEPGKSMKQILLNPTTSIQPYGCLETPFRFIRNQFAIRYGDHN